MVLNELMTSFSVVVIIMHDFLIFIRNDRRGRPKIGMLEVVAAFQVSTNLSTKKKTCNKSSEEKKNYDSTGISVQKYMIREKVMVYVYHINFQI